MRLKQIAPFHRWISLGPCPSGSDYKRQWGCLFCIRTTPTAFSKESQSILKVKTKLGKAKIGGLNITCLSVAKACSTSLVH